MSHLIRRALTVFTATTLSVGVAIAGVGVAQAAEDNVIPDAALRECIATAMHWAGTGASPGHPDYATEAESISEDDLQALLNAWYVDNYWYSSLQCSGVASLEGLDVLAGLQHADVFHYFFSSGGTITDVTPLANLTGLVSLDLTGNEISDVSALAGLTNLISLNLDDNQVDISSLGGLTALSQLHLRNNQITDISALAGLNNLGDLSLGNNQVSDVVALAGLTKLYRLHLNDNQIVDVSPLVGLTNLSYLNVANNKVVDISALAPLLNATAINPYSDVTYHQLQQVSFNGNQITDLSSLARDADGQVRAGNTAGLASEYAGNWGGFMGQTVPALTAVAGTTVALPTVRTASDSVYPIVWRVTGDADINADGTITYKSAGPVQLSWSNPMPATSGAAWAGETETTVTVSTFTGVVSVNVTKAPSVPVEPSAPDSDADKDTVVASTTGGAARLADGVDYYTISASINSDTGTPLVGFAGLLSATPPAGVTVGAWTDNGDGTYSAPVTSAAPGNYVVEVALDGTPIGSIPVNFIAATISQTVRLLTEPQHADGLGFLPGEQVQVTVHSDPIDLGRLTANGVGVVSVDFTVPATFDVGRHTVSFVGATSGSVVVAFDVLAPSAPGVPSAPSAPGGAETGGVVLVSDESAPMGVALAIICLVAAGFAGVMARPRARHAMR